MTKIRSTTFAIVCFALVVGCATDDTTPPGPETLPDLHVPPKPKNGMQVITPIVRDIQPNTDNEICTWTDAITNRPVDVKSTLGHQTAIGHHVIVFYTTVQQPPGTQRPCNDNDMTTFRYVSGNAEGDGTLNEAPGNLVFRIPEGAQIVLNHHYLNATDNVYDGQTVVNINYAEPGGNYITSGAMSFLDLDLNIPPGISSLDIHCPMEREVKLWYLIPHMHRWGKNIKVDLTISGEKMRMFDVAWHDEYTFHPPELRKDPNTPLVMKPGDSVDIHCEWNNDTNMTLNFGFEMCVAFAQTVDDKNLGNRACIKGDWVPF